MHGDNEPFGSVQHVELFNQWPRHARITDNVGIMNRAATEDDRALGLARRQPGAPHRPGAERAGRAGRGHPRPLGGSGRAPPRCQRRRALDEPGPVIMDAAWRPIADAVMAPVFGSLVPDLNAVRGLGSSSGESYVDKDLRTLLGKRVRDRFNLRYCGAGSLKACRSSLWAVVHQTADQLATQLGSPTRRSGRERPPAPGFVPGLLPNTFPTTNRRPSSRCSSCSATPSPT